jgi:hypothetical protein
MFLEGFPAELQNDVIIVTEKIPSRTLNNVTTGNISYIFKGNAISFPGWQYFEEVPVNILGGLTHQQANILHFIYSRSCNGYIREKHVKALLENDDIPQFAVPYIFKVCEEYVVEILDLVYSVLCQRDTTAFKKFCLENRQAFCRSHDRMISYWNEYYRNRYSFETYIGEKLFRECFGYSRSLERL